MLGRGRIQRLPLSGRSLDLNRLMFEHFGLRTSKKTKGGRPALDQEVLGDALLVAEDGTNLHKFLTNLIGYRKRKTALSFIESYRRFWLPVDGSETFCRLHPHLNPT